jgi:hypothetical protein
MPPTICLFCTILPPSDYQVTNDFKKELNVKVQGLGLGGCDVVLDSGEVDGSSCWCLWGTLNYSFCAYEKKPFDMNGTLAEKGSALAEEAPEVQEVGKAKDMNQV